MNSGTVSPRALAWRLSLYYVVVIGVITAVLVSYPAVIQYVPFGGTDALDRESAEDLRDRLTAVGPPTQSDAQSAEPDAPSTESPVIGPQDVGEIALFLFGHLGGTMLVMIPVAMTYRAIKYDVGFSRNFIRSLIILPICATTIVLLIQDSLALAFGLAALVAAVRFRVVLDEAIDGIFVFAAICVGLAAGIGFLGIALIMSMVFCFTNLVLWAIDFGQNPQDDARRAKKRAKLEKGG